MNPIQLPERERAQMNWRAALPTLIYVIAHLLDLARNEMCTHRLVTAALNLNSRRTIVARVGTNAIERDAVEMKKVGWPKPDLAVG